MLGCLNVTGGVCSATESRKKTAFASEIDNPRKPPKDKAPSCYLNNLLQGIEGLLLSPHLSDIPAPRYATGRVPLQKSKDWKCA